MIQAQEKEVEVVLTYKCNWNCTYCCVDTHNQDRILDVELFQKLENIPEDYNITLSGGELGLLSLDKLKTILEKVKEKKPRSISINTNGLFIKNYPELLDEFQTVLYHISPELSLYDNIQMIDHPSIEYMLVLTDDHMDRIKPFLEKHMPEKNGRTLNNKKIHLVPGSNPEGINKPFMSKRNKWLVLKEFRLYMTLESKERIMKEKEFDEIIYI